jgi:hypothetical protein
MKRFLLLLSLLIITIPLHAEVRVALRGGEFIGGDPAAAVELDARYGNWSFAPAYEGIQGGYGLHAYHLDLRRLFQNERSTMWIGAGRTFVRTNAPSSTRTWNADAGFQLRLKSRFEPFVAVRYYSFRLPVFRDVVKDKGPEVSAGVSVRIR